LIYEIKQNKKEKKMPEQSINMRVTANSNQGHRKYMEDCYKIRFQRENQDSDESNILFSYFGIFDGHGGKEAAHYAKEKLYWKIIESEDFWSDDENKILKSIHDGFIKCHSDMWKELRRFYFRDNFISFLINLSIIKLNGLKHQVDYQVHLDVQQQ
jgi:serine/threonine protein phosphatase PrpC